MDTRLILLSTVILCLSWVFGQSTVGNNVADSLLSCYNNSALRGITIADERPPVTLNVFIEYIRMLEDANPTMTPQQLSLQILQRLRQDGIARTERTVDERFGVPFSSSRLERYKFRLILQSFLPNINQALNYGQLTDIKKCSLHYMISNTIDDLQRENEALECSKASRYTSRVLTRRRRGVVEDLENTELINQDPSLLGISTNQARNISQCPVELGVVYSQFGTFKAGNVLAGIAAGLNQQNLQDSSVDNRYAATIIGELCEASLYQASPDVSLGSSGGWNSTINPKYFFLQNNNLLQATDAELRGALDGLYIALRIQNLMRTFSDLKISQILDMYYSPYEKGIFDSSFKACNRNILYTEMTSGNTMRSQLVNFMPVLNSAAISGVSLSNSSFQIFANAGISAFETYLPRMASSDLGCQGITTIERVMADLLIFVDSSWSYTVVQPLLSYILNNIDINTYQSRFTLYSGSSLSNWTSRRTAYLSDFYLNYNQSTHSNATTGFDYVRIFEAVENYGYEKLNNNSYSGGESSIVLLITRTGLTDDQKSFLTQRREVFNRLLPDLNFVVIGSGSASDYSAVVANPNKDAVILTEPASEESLKILGQQVVNIIKEIPRAVINPSCTAQYTETTNSFSLTGYVEPLGTIHYRISPNYFFKGDTRNLRIREQGYGGITVCLSRDNPNPDKTSSTCRDISSSEYLIDISSYCDGYSVTTCPPIYISVSGNNSSIKCNGNSCRFPDEIKFMIALENVGCASGTTVISASIILMFILYSIRSSLS